jgi:type I restriction enzyme R subunit
MNIHTEINFEDTICASLSAAGWLYAEGDAQAYDRARALFPADLAAWVKDTQPKAWAALERSHGAGAEAKLLDTVRNQIDKRGTVDVIRRGVDVIGLRGTLDLVQFKPALTKTTALMERYAANRLRVVRQVRYSLHNENSIDLVLFLNGIPVATAELKTDFTQSVGDAVDQYRFDRDPKPKGQGAEPLLAFSSGAIVHFAVSDSEVRMSTHLKGAKTFFLPLNKGRDGGVGNPDNPAGHMTSYLWEEIWARDSWLEIMGRYVIEAKNDKGVIEKLIFPRYHQLDATRKLVAAVREEGAGGKFLVQHSAGSGKTNSIAWTAHLLADLHDERERKVFDTVIVVSDRRVIDGQLQEAIFSFERNRGVVATITGDGKSKSAALAEALGGNKKIVVCTIQTFPFAMAHVRELTATEGKTFAVIADEAHSSQSGEAAAKLKELLSPEEQEALGDGGEVSIEDLLALQMAARAKEAGITYVAFTATPKTKTMEMFGRRPRPDEPAGPDNLPVPFHVYSMRQAIEEGFILDVLRNYMPYQLAFKLAKKAQDGGLADEAPGIDEVDRKEAAKELMRLVALHPYNISQKIGVIVEHFRHTVAPLLDGKAKAMIVVSSRKEAVRWKLALDKYIAEKGYQISALAAFSGEVKDDDIGPDGVKETSEFLNPGLRGRDIRKAFDTDSYRLLLVANKFQTGFDQPLLCAMYVDKKLAGIQAVQTLSRLNRSHPGKPLPYVLDFANSAEDVLKAFKVYYETAEMEAATDPELIFDLRRKLDALGVYDQYEIERVVTIKLAPKGVHEQLSAALAPVAQRLLTRFGEAKRSRVEALQRGDEAAAQAGKDVMDALLLFKGDMGAFVRLYAFLSQIVDYGTTEVEKRAIFYRHLLPLLEFGREREAVDIGTVELSHHRLTKQDIAAMQLAEGEAEKLRPISEVGGGKVQDKEKAKLDEIIQRLNDIFGTELTDENVVNWSRALRDTLASNPDLRAQAQNNTKEQFAASPTLDSTMMDAVIGNDEQFAKMNDMTINDPLIMAKVKAFMLLYGGLYEHLRGKPER